MSHIYIDIYIYINIFLGEISLVPYDMFPFFTPFPRLPWPSNGAWTPVRCQVFVILDLQLGLLRGWPLGVSMVIG